MRGFSAAVGIGLGAAVAAASPAEAGVTKLHTGVIAHNICIQNCDNSGKEEGVNVELQADFESPEFLKIIWSPTPYVVGSLNTAGDTSFAGFGLDWHVPLSQHWSLQPGLGYVVHNGETELPYASGTPEAADFSSKHVLLGSRDLFRLSLNLERDLPGPWSAELEVIHVSHGQILGTGRNQGLDQAGLRLSYSFGE